MSTPTPSGTPPGAASAGSGQTPARRFLVQFSMTACEEYTAPTAAAALRDAENSDGPDLPSFTGDEGPEVVAEWDNVAEEWKDMPTPGALHRVPTSDLISELQRRQAGLGLHAFAGDIEPCLILALTPSDLAEYWECDESGATHPGSRVPEAKEWHAIRHAFDRWQDCGNFSDLMQTLRDAWQEEQARHLDGEGGRNWVIKSDEIGTADYWSNSDGWTHEIETADRFTDYEKQTLNLPIGGAWVRMEGSRA